MMISWIKKFIYCLYKSFTDTVEHDGIEYAGYLTFLILLAIFPFLTFFVSAGSFIAKILNNYETTKEFIREIFIENISDSFLSALKPRINEIISGPPQSLVTLSILGAIWTSSSAVEGIRTILNRASRVVVAPSYIWRRLLSIFQFLVIVMFMMLASTSLIILPIIINYISKFIDISQSINLKIIQYYLSTSVLFFGLIWIYVMIPNKKNKWSESIPGAVLVLFLWSLISNMFKIYISKFSQLSLIYGSLEGIIISIIFFYLAGLCFIYGAEFNYNLSKIMKLK